MRSVSLKKARVKAISPIIAVLILIGIAVAGGILVWTVMTSYSKPKTVVQLDVVSTDVTIPPDGSEASITLVLKNSGTVRITIQNVAVEYAGASKKVDVNMDIMSGGQISWSFTIKATDLRSGVKFRDGDTIKLTIAYTDSQGNTYQKTIYPTIHIG